MIVNLSEKNSLVSQFLREIRDVEIQKDRMRFRRNIERIGEIAAYEISKTLDYTASKVTTSLGTATTSLLASQPVLGTILRAGLPLHQGLLNYFDHADNAFISAFRDHADDGSFEIRLKYMSSASIDGKVLIIADPMLATGLSMALTLAEIYKIGEPKHTHIVSVIASSAGISHVQEHCRKISIWTGAIDPELNERYYIVPGLGDAGDLAFGSSKSF